MLSNSYTFNAGDERIIEVTRAFDRAYAQEIHALRHAMGDTAPAKRKAPAGAGAARFGQGGRG